MTQRRTDLADPLLLLTIRMKRAPASWLAKPRVISRQECAHCERRRRLHDKEDWLSGQRSVLLVEDEYFLQADLKKALTDAGFSVESVASGEEALALFFGGNTTYTALVTDVRLRDGMTGWDLARRIRELEPAFPVVYVTGSSANEWASEGVLNSVLISKPFRTAQLVTAVTALLDIQAPSVP